jgi:hypothetical protein
MEKKSWGEETQTEMNRYGERVCNHWYGDNFLQLEFGGAQLELY